ncbi:hypothetical protein HID58_059858 [Brassica napus]|uniref:Uncharacterized protein n=1 Tax=Brassica napus TaxID=3708 RepID=A0ABQ7ZUM2_BRANA|nr:hypothetical protein HID58_059858 [Brassica napus]
MAMKPNGKSPVSFANDEKVMFFKDVSPGPHETQLQLPSGPFLGGSKASKKDTYCPVNAPHRRTGSVYKFFNFYGSKKTLVYWVADHSVTVSFSWNSNFPIISELHCFMIGCSF